MVRPESSDGSTRHTQVECQIYWTLSSMMLPGYNFNHSNILIPLTEGSWTIKKKKIPIRLFCKDQGHGGLRNLTLYSLFEGFFFFLKSSLIYKVSQMCKTVFLVFAQCQVCKIPNKCLKTKGRNFQICLLTFIWLQSYMRFQHVFICSSAPIVVICQTRLPVK